MLTLKDLKEMKPYTIFASGLVKDSPEGININRTGLMLRWVAVRGGIWDWAVYYHFANWTNEEIKAEGDKVCFIENIKKLVPCDDEAFKMYRF